MQNGSTVSSDGSASVVLDRRGDLVSAPMTVEKYLRDYWSRLDDRCFGEIYSSNGDLEFHGQHGDERLTRGGGSVVKTLEKLWKEWYGDT